MHQRTSRPTLPPVSMQEFQTLRSSSGYQMAEQCPSIRPAHKKPASIRLGRRLHHRNSHDRTAQPHPTNMRSISPSHHLAHKIDNRTQGRKSREKPAGLGFLARGLHTRLSTTTTVSYGCTTLMRTAYTHPCWACGPATRSCWTCTLIPRPQLMGHGIHRAMRRYPAISMQPRVR